MNLILIILLGCNIANILNDRVETAFNFAKNLVISNTNIKNPYEFDWILTGGNKDKRFLHTVTEAEKMKIKLNYKKQQHFLIGKTNFNYLVDSQSTNTVENLFFVNNYLERNNYYDSVYIVTSKYHQPRVKTIWNKISQANNFTINWVLAQEENPDLVYWETVHALNINLDFEKAINKYNFMKQVDKIEYEVNID